MDIIVRVALCVSSALLVIMAANYYIHMLQLEGYFVSQFLRHLFARVKKPSLIFKKTVQKKPLVYTARIKRLYFVLAVLVLLIETGIFFLAEIEELLVLIAVAAVPLTSPLVLLAAITAIPMEKAVAAYFINDAKKKLRERPDLKIIALTGSYGKTSTKFILSTLLSEKYACLTPPASYNTTLGVVRVIRERLQRDDQIFICEMGSRHIGDIKEICDLVHPDHAIITSIGPQHLDTFLSIEGVKKGKFELIEGIKPDGIAVFASSNSDILELYDKTENEKYTAGFRSKDDLRAENIVSCSSGSAFTLVYGDEKIECSTLLLGKHNIQNILVASMMTLKMGLTLKEIQRGISKLKPVEHRLQIVAKSPVTIIDDAFNSSPNGAAAALEVLGSFTGRRIIVTPGFVELGKEEDRYHMELGKRIGVNADIAVLVGIKRTEKIKEGIAGSNCQVYQVASLNEATQLLEKITVSGDTVLFENDLPDNYE